MRNRLTGLGWLMIAAIALCCGMIIFSIVGCAIHRQPKLTQAQQLLLHTPAHTSQAPTPNPDDF